MPFFSRCLFTTVDRLDLLGLYNPKFGMVEKLTEDQQVMVRKIQTLFHLKKYSGIFSLLRCPNRNKACVGRNTGLEKSNVDQKVNNPSYTGENCCLFYLCSCCSTYSNFMRNYSRYLHLEVSSQVNMDKGDHTDEILNYYHQKYKKDDNEELCCLSPNSSTDSFCHYLIAILHRNRPHMMERHLLVALGKNPLFYEALKELMPICREKLQLIGIYDDTPKKTSLKQKGEVSNGKNIDILKENSILLNGFGDIKQEGQESIGYAKMLIWEMFKIEFFIYFYVDLGVTRNKIIQLEEKDTDKVEKFDLMAFIGRIRADESISHDLKEKFSLETQADENTPNSSLSRLKEMLFPKKKYVPTCHEHMNHKTLFFLNNLKAAYYYSRKWYNISISMFNKAITCDYFDFFSHILYIRGDTRGLCLLAYYILERDSFSVEGLICLGNFHSLKKEWENSVKWLKMALIYRPDMVYLNNLIGHEYLNNNQAETAIKYFNKCRDYRSLFGVGQSYLKLEMHHIAVEMFRRSLDLNNKNVYGWHYLGNTLRKMNRYNESINCFKEIYRLRDPMGYLLVGEVYKEQKMYEKAVRYFEKYLKCKNDPKIKRFVAEYYKLKKKKEEHPDTPC